MNVHKVGALNLEDAFRTLKKIVQMSDYCRLRELMMPGGSAQVEEYLPVIEDLCYFLSSRAKKLAKLHLPVGSNACLEFCSKMPNLHYLVVGDFSLHIF